MGKFSIIYDVECDSLADVIRIIKEIDNETGMVPASVKQYLTPTDKLLPTAPEQN